jgi:hypothetical protein
MRALPPGVRGQRPASVSEAARRVWLTARRQPLEAAAIVVMVLGVLIFPPLWLAGVFIAFLSRFWDLRDKLVALAGPALLTVVGTGVGLATGTTHSSAAAYIREAGALSTDLLTAGAVLGAVYLGWRLARGRRQESTPPWMRTPHH